MPPLRVAVVLEQLWHRVPGGTATSALGAAAALARCPEIRQVGVSARHGHGPPSAFAPPIEVRALPLPRPALYEAWSRWRRPGVERACGPVDVVHATGFALPPATAPLVVTIHDLAFLHDPQHFTRRGRWFLGRAVELARSEAAVVVCPSDHVRRDCIDHGFVAGRLRVVRWGTDAGPAVQASAAEVRRVRRRYGLRRPYLLFVGTVEPRKNLRTLLEALAASRTDLELVLAGPDGWREDLRGPLARAGARARRLGFVPVADLRPLYAGATALCYPSLREGFGLPVLEAMAQGTPAVVSAGTACAELVDAAPPDDDAPGRRAGWTVEALDVDGWRAALERIGADPRGAASVGQRARSVASGFTWERCARELAGAYRDAAGTGPT